MSFGDSKMQQQKQKPTRHWFQYERLLQAAVKPLSTFVGDTSDGKTNDKCPHHGTKHASRVLMHSRRALLELEAPLPIQNQYAVLFAALLHDADDPKVVEKKRDGSATDLYPNARAILKDLVPELEADVIEMISWVSSRDNGNRIPLKAKTEPWRLIPRYADRIEAVGYIGIVRAWDVTKKKGSPFFTKETPRCVTEDEIWEVATPEREDSYNGTSTSMIGHYYDKLLRATQAETQNPYLNRELRSRAPPLLELCIDYGRTGTLDPAIREKAEMMSLKEIQYETEADLVLQFTMAVAAAEMSHA